MNTNIPKQEMKELLYIYTKNSKTLQIDNIAIWCLLVPVLANIFMVGLEQNIIPTLSNDTSLWKKYVDDTVL